MAAIGRLLTFNEFIKNHCVEIPRIQRDYTYGSGTEKTEKVVEKLLTDIYSTLTNNNSESRYTLILDFIYGSDTSEGMFQPLDGQQRLTTLFLLHVYAAWKAGKSTNDLQFRYATRNNTSDFCRAITNPSRFKYSNTGGKPSDQITDCPFFLPSFNDDPSIRSMLVVLDKIDNKFKDLAGKDSDNLWDKLTNNCDVKFYTLDFEKFKRSDELYIKMNSRGKALTEYEIFKSQLEKYIEVALNDKELMYKFSSKFDTDYTDLVWSEMNMDKSKIDSAFVWLFRNLLTIRHFKNKGTTAMPYQKFIGDYIPDEHDPTKNTGIWNINKDDINFILDFLNVFHSIMMITGIRPDKDKSANDILWNMIFYSDYNIICEPEQAPEKMRIRMFNKDVNLFRTACAGQLKYAEIIMLYAYYLAFKEHPLSSIIDTEEVESWRKQMNPLRHIRNLVDNSNDELSRPNYISYLMDDVQHIIRLGIANIDSSRFNKTQLLEEKEKAKKPDLWKTLYRYENHEILRGALSIFALGNQSGFDISNPEIYEKICERLQKFEHIFDNDSKKNDRLIRAALLSIVDFGRVSYSDQKHRYNNRMIGCTYGSWRLLFTISKDFYQNGIIEAIDKFPINGNVAVQNLSKNDWRFYATHENYRDYSYVSYANAGYGYFNYRDQSNKPLEIFAMQSSQSHNDNIMYKLLTKILWEIRTANGEKFISSRNARLGNCIPDSGIHIDHLTIDISQKGWSIQDDCTKVIDSLSDMGYQIDDKKVVVIVPDDEDYIQFGLKLVDDIDCILKSQDTNIDYN